MKICFSIADQSFQRAKSIGILNVSLGLLDSLAQSPEMEKLVVLGNSSLALPKMGSNAVVVNNDSAAKGRLSRIIWDQWKAYQAAAKSGCDWLILPKGFGSFAFKPPIRLAAYVHDAMQDFYRTHYPEAVSKAEAWYFDRSFAATLRHASAIFTNSDFSHLEVLRMAKKLGVRPPPVVTAGIGFQHEPIAGGGDGVVLLVSKWPHKLTRLAIEYLSRWQRETAYADSVNLVGQFPDGIAPPSFPNWKHFQRLPESAYVEMLKQARVLVYFSEYEGFGMPPIEAILYGTVPVYSRIPAMTESCAGCGLSFENGSEEEFKAALNEGLHCDASLVASWAAILKARHNWKLVTERISAALIA